ncbi:wax ester/triacylglycerol synthase domain-containing protein [Nocardia sp. NPDC001965]
MGSRSSHMSQADLFTWSMEHDPVLRSTIVTVLVLDSAPDWERVIRTLDRGTRLVPRFRHVLVASPLGLAPPRWTPDADFDLSWHLRRVALPPPADEESALELARIEAMTAFDPARPLWTFTLLTGPADGVCAAVLKVHHSLTDGLGGVQIAAEILDFTREGTEPDPVRERAETSVSQLADILAWNWATGYELLKGGLSTAAALGRAVLDPIAAARAGAALATSVARLARPITTTLSPLMTERGLGRRPAVLDIPLNRLSAAADRAGCTVNDAFLTGLLLGLRAYHARHGAAVDRVRVTVPISLREPGDPIGGNRITLARFGIPIADDDVLNTMWTVHELVDRWRHEPAIPLSHVVAAVFNRLPSSALAEMLKHVDFVASDVPGSPVPLYLAGARIERIRAFGPTIGTAFNATLISYVGTCSVGITVDTAAVPDLPEFTACLRVGFQAVHTFGEGSRTPGTGLVTVVPHQGKQ